MIDIDKIRNAKNNICDAILTQVRDGAQSSNLDDALACGQFLNVLPMMQRGFHGTAAAIRVLAGYDNTYNEQLRKLINYIENVDSIENNADISDLIRDKNNIIKNAEILYSLKYIQTGTAKTENLKQKLSEKLLSSKNLDGGWAYFTDVTEDSDIYSTALVFFALKIHNYNNLTNTFKFLKNQLNHYKTEKIPDPTTFSKLCFVTYTFVKLNLHNKDEYKGIKKLLIDIFKKLWKSEYCVINSDFEQNIEYPCKQKHYYVRIPWQLYLISIANNLLPRYFAKRQSISRLNDIITSTLEETGFMYKQSGKYISSRTYSILFEVLGNIEDNFNIGIRFYFHNIIDRIRSFFGNRIFKNFIAIIGAILIVYLIYNWFQSDSFNIESVAPSIIASLLIISITFGKTK